MLKNRDCTDVITGTFTIDSGPYFAVINIGSTHSYVDYNMFEKLGIWVENTTGTITIVSPLGQPMGVDKVYKRFPLEIQGVVFPANLMELPFGEFDLILGMDWLVKD